MAKTGFLMQLRYTIKPLFVISVIKSLYLFLTAAEMSFFRHSL